MKKYSRQESAQDFIKRFSYLSPEGKRLFNAKSTERIFFNKSGFSSPKCVRASHEMFMPLKKTLFREKTDHLDLSKSVVLNNRRIGEKLLFDSFPNKSSEKDEYN